MTSYRARRVLISMLTYGGIIAVTLVLVDLVCIVSGVFPPTQNYGDADLGWRSSPPTGQMLVDRCTDSSTGEVINYVRNEDGVRTPRSVREIQADAASFKIAVTGDSQTNLCAPNAETHPGVLEAELVAQGSPSVVLAYGVGRYSPLQDYLAFRKVLRPYNPGALVLNFYTGNDFLDLLRADDRPHFVPADSGYWIGEPVWFLYDDPRVQRWSRVLLAFRLVADKTGLRGAYLRLRQLQQLADDPEWKLIQNGLH